MNLALIGNPILRSAIHRNLVSFPSQIPAFIKHGDTQKRIVQLYFVRRWPIRAICNRHGLSKSSVRKVLSEWRIRAVAAGYIQDVHPELLATFAIEEDARLQETILEESAPDSDITPSWSGWESALPSQPDHAVSAAVRW